MKNIKILMVLINSCCFFSYGAEVGLSSEPSLELIQIQLGLLKEKIYAARIELENKKRAAALALSQLLNTNAGSLPLYEKAQKEVTRAGVAVEKLEIEKAALQALLVEQKFVQEAEDAIGLQEMLNIINAD